MDLLYVKGENMKLIYRYFDKDPRTQDTYYSQEHIKEIVGTDASSCMRELRHIKNNNDCLLHTAIEIIGIED